jgi:outer membrane protein insertion porin family
VNPGELTATLRFQVAPGPKASLGEVEFQGDSLVPESFIRKKLTFSSGDVYSQEKLERSQEEIFETGLFQYAIIRAQKDSLIKNRLPVLVRVKEQPQWGFEGGVGYGTEDRFRLSAELIKRHFMGGARRLILEAKRSYYLPVSLDARFIQPDVFNQELDLVLNPFFLREREESYEVDRLGAGLTLQKKFSRSLSTFLTYTLERDNLLDKTLPDSISQKAVHNKSGLTLGINKNSTDNIFEPTKGWRLEGYMTLMGLGFRSRYDYLKFDLEARHYEQISPDYILAGKLGVGLIQPFKEDQATPIEDRFLIGGASSLRGWSRNTISPQDENGKAVGGNSMLEASLELRFPVYDIVSGTLFADAGNVWANAMYFDLGNLYYDAGVGIRVQTPIGPIRMDVAFPLTEEAFRSQFYISLGHAF